MKPIVVVIHATMDANAVEFHVAALDNAHGMISAVFEENVTHHKILTLMKKQMVRTVCPSEPRRRRNSTAGAAELRALAVDCPRTFDSEILGLDRKDERPVAVFQSSVSLQRNFVDRAILPAISAPQQFAFSRKMQRDIAFHLDGSDNEDARRNHNRAALVLIARINRGLDGRGIERGTIALSSNTVHLTVRLAYRFLIAIHPYRRESEKNTTFPTNFSIRQRIAS